MQLKKLFIPLLRFLKHHPALLLVPIWLGVQVFLFLWFGVKVVFDSHRYLAYADSFADSTNYWYQSSSILYSSYTLFLFFFLYTLKLPIVAVIIFQIIVSGVAAIALYHATYLLINNKLSAALTTLLYVVWPDLQAWNLYVHTESLYTSFTIFILYLFVKGQRQLITLKKIHLLALLLLIMFMRPNGMFLGIGITVALIFSHTTSNTIFFNRYLLLIITLLVLFFVAVLLLEVFSPIQYLYNGQVIQGYNDITVTMNLPPASDNSKLVIFQLLEFFLYQPLQCVKLLLLRLFFFLAQVRPYYSLKHNIVIILFFLPIYSLVISTLGKLRLRHPVITFIVTVTLLHTFMVMSVSVDWDNRFITPLLPFIFLLAGWGISTINLAPLAEVKFQ